MFYRENGQFKSSYASDQQMLPILQDRVFMAGLLAFAFVGVPLLAKDPATGKWRRIVWVGIGLAVFQQFVGINVVFYYGIMLWEAVGFTEQQAFTTMNDARLLHAIEQQQHHRQQQYHRAHAHSLFSFQSTPLSSPS